MELRDQMSGGVWGRLFRLAVLVLGASSLRAADYVPWRDAEVPEPLRECRATWVATVYNLDWPSKPGLPTEVQQEELRGILDGVAKLNLNTVVLQVRTMCDAFFDSPLEPWSYYLTDKVGRAPDPWYDPLAFAIEECHARGLELHAWINPFRATTAEFGGELPDNHIVKEFPWLVRKAGPHFWLDPSTEFVRNRAVSVTFDLVNRYDLDGIQIDDYFYPYPGAGGGPDFDDEENWRRYFNEGGLMSRDDWRRENVDSLVKYLYEGVKRAKPWVKFGVSPFGIWSKGHPPEVPSGLDARAELYADSRRWLREGWLDYLAPQLYWTMEGRQPLPALARWWHSQNAKGRHIWPGIATSRVGRGGEGDGRRPSEMVRQIETLRKLAQSPPGVAHASADNILPPPPLVEGVEKASGIPAEDSAAEASGALPEIEPNPFDEPPAPVPVTSARYPEHLHWHWEVFAKNRGSVVEALRDDVYGTKAIPPPSPWLVEMAGKRASDGPPLPVVDLKARSERTSSEKKGEPAGKEWVLSWNGQAAGGNARWWVIQMERKGAWSVARMLPASVSEFRWKESAEIQGVAVQALDAYGRLSDRRALRRK